MEGLGFINAPWMYIYVGVILLLILGQNYIMMRKAWKHAKNDLGYTDAQIRKGLVNGIIVSIVPTIPVIVVLLALVALLGGPLPWLRLSVIGSVTLESVAATAGIESVGETLTIGGYTVAGWIAACWVMSLGNSSSLVWSTFAIRPISRIFEAAEKFDINLVTSIGAGCLCGIMGYASVNFGLNALSTKGVIFACSFILGTILTLIRKSNPKLKWINDWLMAICMVFGMIVACFLFN